MGKRIVEAKTKAAGFASYAAALVMLTWLGTQSTDFVHALPDWLEAPAYALVPALSALLAGYVKSHAPGKMSGSAVRAVSEGAAQERMKARGYEAI